MPTPTTTPAAQSRARGLIAELADREEISRLVHRLGATLDEGRFDDLRSLYAEDATARTPGGVSSGIDALVAQASRNHLPDDVHHHVITGVLVDVDPDGDRASVRANLVVVFARRDPSAAPPTPFGPEPPTALGEVYRFTARRTADGWRLASVATTPLWVSFSPVTPLERNPVGT
jgi:SnoaL-like domain